VVGRVFSIKPRLLSTGLVVDRQFPTKLVIDGISSIKPRLLSAELVVDRSLFVELMVDRSLFVELMVDRSLFVELMVNKLSAEPGADRRPFSIAPVVEFSIVNRVNRVTPVHGQPSSAKPGAGTSRSARA